MFASTFKLKPTTRTHDIHPNLRSRQHPIGCFSFLCRGCALCSLSFALIFLSLPHTCFRYCLSLMGATRHSNRLFLTLHGQPTAAPSRKRPLPEVLEARTPPDNSLFGARPLKVQTLGRKAWAMGRNQSCGIFPVLHRGHPISFMCKYSDEFVSHTTIPVPISIHPFCPPRSVSFLRR